MIGLVDLETRRKNPCLDFARKCIKKKKLSHMFPKNPKTHNMNTRKDEIHKVHHANTRRYQKSSLIYKSNKKKKRKKNTIMLQRKIDMKAKNTKRWTKKYCKSVNF